MFTTRVDLSTLERNHVSLSDFCVGNCFVYIDNRNIKDDCLYQEGLHLLGTGNKILDCNFIFVLNEWFLEINTHHLPVRFLLRKVT